MPSTRAINPFANLNPPVLYGSLSYERSFEGLPQCSLTIDYVPHSLVDKYISTYALLGKEYVIFGSVFVVDSYDLQTSNTPLPDSPDTIKTYTLKITYKSAIEQYGSSVIVQDIKVPVNSNSTSTVSYASLVSKTSIRTNGNFEVRLAEFEEYKNIRRYNLLNIASSYCRLYEQYVDYSIGKEINFRAADSGRLIAISSSLVYQLFEYNNNISAPVLLKSCYSPPLYETLELYYNSKSTEIPKYISEPLVSRVVCSSTDSIVPDIEVSSHLNYFGSTVYQVDRYIGSGEKTVKCQLFIGKNVIGEYMGEFDLDPSAKASASQSINATSPDGFSFSTSFTGVGTFIKWSYFQYEPLPYSYPLIRVKIYINDKTEYVPLTIVYATYSVPKYLSKVDHNITKRERLTKFSSRVSEDRIKVERELQRARIQENRARIDFQRANFSTDSDFEAVLSAQLKYLQAKHEVKKKENDLFLIEYQQTTGKGKTEYKVAPYNLRKTDWVSGSIIRERPEVYGIPAPTDSNGYAYYMIPDPNWKPPYYVFQEISSEDLEYRSWVGNDYLDAAFRKIVYRDYVQKRIDYLLREEEKLIEPTPYVNIRPDYYPEYPEDMTYGTEDYDDYIAQVLELEYEKKEIDAERMPDKIVLGGFSKVITERILAPSKETTVSQNTGKYKDTIVDAYIESTTEVAVSYRSQGNINKTTTSFVLGRPPEPTYWQENYVPLDPRIFRETQNIYVITSSDWLVYSYLGDLAYYAKRNEDLPSYPTTAFNKYIKALATDMAFDEMKGYKLINLSLIGLLPDIYPGDYIKINDIPELSAGDYRVISVSFTINFKGYDPDNNPLAICEETRLTLGKYRQKQFTWTKIPLPKMGETQYEVSNE